jgi:CRP/FNR family transcriptional regulator
MNSSYGSCFLTGTQQLFDTLDPAVLDRIADKSKVYQLYRNNRMQEEFSLQDNVYIIHMGKIFLSYIDADGKKIILDILSDGDIFGDLDFENQSAHHDMLFVEPFTDASVCELPKAEFKEILQANPEFAVSLLSKLSNRLSSLEQKIGTLAFSDVEARIMAQLMHLSNQYGTINNNEVTVEFRVTHEKLAEMVGAARETVSETLSLLKKKGILKQNENRYFVLNVDAVDRLF